MVSYDLHAQMSPDMRAFSIYDQETTNSTLIDSEIQTLLTKPYHPNFWAQNTLIKPNLREQRQIQIWENSNRFYSDNRLSQTIAIDSLVKVMNKNIVAIEKVYLETDRSFYLAGDTIWFGAFVFDNQSMDSTSMSKILYVDLINTGNKLEKRLKLLIKNGRAKGDFALNRELKDGIFRIRAYTHWMRNFQSEYLFEKDIPVYRSDRMKFMRSDTAFIPEQQLSLPLKPDIDIQFFPESGKMVAGIETVVAWKSTDSMGNPIEFNADIVDENKQIAAHIAGNKSGIGKFSFTPRLAHTYKAIVNFQENKYVFNLPITEPTGYVLAFNPDSSVISIKSNTGESRHYVLVSVRGSVYTAFEAKLSTSPTRVHLPFETYPKGIVQITLFDSLFRPLAERLAFNNRPDKKMLIHVETDQKEYRQREKVNLTVNVTDIAGKPVESSLLVAVTDASKTDSLACFMDIESYLCLGSELKGKIDYSLFNLNDTSLSGIRNIDLVMMTQGWRNYLWNSIRYCRTLTKLYPVEKGFYLDVSVSGFAVNKPVNDYKLVFFDDRSFFNDVINPDESGRFKIEFPLFYDTHTLVIQNKNRKGKTDDLDFTLDTVSVPEISFRNNEILYTSNNPGYLKAVSEKFAEADPVTEPPAKDILLKEVEVTAKKLPSYSLNPDITINLDDRDPTGKKYSNVMDMIRKEFGQKAFTGSDGRPCMPALVINGNPEYFDARNAPVRQISNVRFYKAGSEYSQFISKLESSTFLSSADMEKISLEVLSKTVSELNILRPVVSLTLYYHTYRGNPKGTIVFPFQGIYRAKEFYKPDYGHDKGDQPDKRATIYWNPEVKTDSTGKADISFYNSDLRGNAVIRVSGVSYYLKGVSSSVSHYKSD
jgi:hypothetical protein